MTPKERMRAAMDVRVPDRVPLMCQLSIGHMLLQLGVSPVEFWNDVELYAEGIIRLRDIYDFDGVLVSLHGHHPEWSSQLLSIKRTADGEEVVLKDGTKILYPFDDLPQPLEGNAHQKPLLSSIGVNDLPQKLDYIPVSQGLHFLIDQDHPFDVFKIIKEKTGSAFSIHGEITSPFDYYLDFFGHEAALMGLIDESAKAKFVLAHFTRLVKDLSVRMCGMGVDAIKISSPFAGSSFISADFYRQFVLPYEGEIVRAIRTEGVHAYLHTCGAIDDRLELMFESGASGIECLDPPPLGNVELENAKARTKGKGFIKGNIDSVNTLLSGDRKTILEDTRRRIEVGREGGGFILSTACSVAPRVQRSHLQLLREAVERWG